MRWDPSQYARFGDERGRPFMDLVARIDHRGPRRVIDLGCGPANLTALLAQRWPDALVEGIDSSPEMIERASSLATPRLSFRLADVAGWQLTPDIDVVVSNATLQWVPTHLDLLGRWAAELAPGAWLAFQVPGNFEAPSHTLMRELATSARWRTALGDVLRHHDSVRTPETYARLLLDAGLLVDVWETSYLHQLTGEDPVLEWVRGTGLRPVLSALSAQDGAEFEHTYAHLLREAYPSSAHGTLFEFRRIFAVANRPA
ncbi:MAG: trans-aconitate 2-methyltransferase [Actinomycetota bacterium]|nr:trans-aconitate 2-methyltransferase [Actinomycetota bacterium]